MQAPPSSEAQGKQLEKLWAQFTAERIIQGKTSQYKINKNQFLGRGGFGIVYGGIRRTPLGEAKEGENAYTYQEVAIKEFKKSDKWRHEEDQDKEVLLLSKYGSMLSKEYVLEVIEVFQERQTNRYFLITPLARGGNLCDRMRGKVEEEEIYQFALRLAWILKYIHYDALASFRSKERGEEQKQRVAIIHRDVKPQNIVFMGKDMKSLYLLDFGIAKIGYTEFLKGYNNCGTSYYKAPQITEGRVYNSKVDVYGYGCTLYQLINDGEKLISSSGVSTRYSDRDRYLKNKLIDLHLKLQKSKKIKFPGYWIKLLSQCLAYEIKKRFSSEELLDFVANNPYNRGTIEDMKPFYGQIADKQRETKYKRDIFEINFETFRLTVMQDVIFTIFEFIYFQQPRISKFTLYVLLKFIVLYFLERYSKLKERCKAYEKTPKLSQLKNAIDERKIYELRDKAQEKITKEVEKEKSNDLMQNKKNLGPNQEILKRYPELMSKDTAEPKRILYEFCYQKKGELLQNEKFAKFILTIISYMEDFDYYDQLKVENADLENYDVEVLSVRKLYGLKKSIDERLSKDGLKSKLDCCRVEASLKSNINKEENKTDLQIERNVS